MGLERACLLSLTLCVVSACTGWPGLSGGDVFESINDYREYSGLEAIFRSESLDEVAQAHADDLAENRPVGGKCNLHSWSDNGAWTACCYTDDHAEAECMWSKPAELTSYTGNGYEIASAGVSSAEEAVRVWGRSDDHRAVMLNEDVWADTHWNALGGALSGGYAVAWFGEEKDSAGDTAQEEPILQK